MVRHLVVRSAGATELQALFQSLGQPVSYQKLFNIMEQYDLDESGQLDFGEFLRLFWCAAEAQLCWFDSNNCHEIDMAPRFEPADPVTAHPDDIWLSMTAHISATPSQLSLCDMFGYAGGCIAHLSSLYKLDPARPTRTMHLQERTAGREGRGGIHQAAGGQRAQHGRGAVAYYGASAAVPDLVKAALPAAQCHTRKRKQRMGPAGTLHACRSACVIRTAESMP